MNTTQREISYLPSNGCELVLANVPLSQRVLLRTLATGLERNLDLAPLISHNACEFKGAVALYQKQLAYRIETGTPWIAALQQTPKVLDSSLIAAISLAEKDGCALALLKQLVENSGNLDESVSGPSREGVQEIVRSMAGMLLAMFFVSFFMLFIAPVFEKMFDEFGIPFPGFCGWIFEKARYLPLMMFAGVAILIAALSLNVPILLSFVQNRFSWLAWQVNWVSERAKLLSVLALLARSQQGFKQGLETIAMVHPTSSIRRKLQNAIDRMGDGAEPCLALLNARIIDSYEYGSLITTGEGNARSWLFNQFAARRAEQSRDRLWWTSRLAGILCHLLFGSIVTLFALTVFMFLTALIFGLS